MELESDFMEFPGGPVVNKPASAEVMHLIPVSERFHKPWGNYAHELQLLKLKGLKVSVLQLREAFAMRCLCTATREKPVQKLRPSTAQIRNIILKILF